MSSKIMRIEISPTRNIELKQISEIGAEGMNTYLFFLLLFLYHLIFIFQGVDVGDAGSYASFYQQIFDHPESVQYNFMYWFSGIMGGLYVKAFPGLGLWGIRLAGVIVSLSTILVAYNLLKPYLKKSYLQLIILILTLFVNNNPKELYYNNISSLLYVIVIYLLFSGLRQNKTINIFFCGVFISLNMFNRLPNLLGIGIIIGILLYGYLYNVEYKKQLKDCFLLLLGFIISTALVILIMHQMGHLPLFINALKIVFALGKEVKQDNGLEGSYGIAHLIKILYTHFKFSILSAMIFFSFVLVVIPTAQWIKEKYLFPKWKNFLPDYLFLILLGFLIISMKIDNIIVLYFFTGICLTSAAIMFFTNKNKEINFLMFLGCFFAVVHPMGSSEGIHRVIIYSLWLAFPIALEYLFNITNTTIDLHILGKYGDLYSKLSVKEGQLRKVKQLGTGVVIFACLFYSLYYPYFDTNNRFDMNYSINNKYLKGIYTSKERATALNELLAESSKYVKPNDYVLAYDCIPLYHYITETKPYLRNPWPWLYQTDVFRTELAKSSEEIKILPVVVIQIVRTMGPNGGNWPDYSSKETNLNWKLSEGRYEMLKEFLKENNYKEVWTNKAFKILIPDKPVPGY